MVKLNKKQLLLKELENSFGIVTLACKNLSVSRQTHYRWYKSDLEYKNKVDELTNIALDFAETQLYKLIEQGNTQAIIFFLRTKGKRRGYVEKQEVEYKNKLDNIQINIIKPQER